MKKPFFYWVLPLFFLFLTGSVFAQGGKVLVQNDKNENGVVIKWYSSELYYPKGVNLYRQEVGSGNWQKLNTTPIIKQNEVPPAVYRQDSTLKFFVETIRQVKKAEIKDFILLNLLLKSFDSPVFSRFLGIQYEDPTATPGKRYQYRIAVLTAQGEAEFGVSAPIQAGSFVPEAAPQNVTAKADTNRVLLRWDPDNERFYGVNIYRTTAASSRSVKLNVRPVMVSLDLARQANYPAVMFIDSAVQVGVTYRYQLAGKDFFGEETALSAPRELLVKDLIPPASPEDLKDKVNNLEVRLSWKQKPAAERRGNSIYRGRKSAGPFEKIGEVRANDTLYVDRVPQAGPYYYYVAAVDESGNEGPSDKRFVEVHDIVPPSRPQKLVAKADTGKIFLRWQANPEADVVGYLIYRTVSKNDRRNFVLLNAAAIQATEYTDILPRRAKNNFLYKIVALDSAFNKSEFSDIASARMPDVVPPEKPFIKGIKPADNGLQLQWLPNKEPDLATYQLFRSTEQVTGFAPLTDGRVSGSVTSFLDQTAQPHTTYYYYLQAIDSTGNHSEKSDVYAGSDNRVEKYPFPPNSVEIAYDKLRKGAKVTWFLPERFTPAGFVVYRKESEKGTPQPVSGNLQSREFTDKDIKQGVAYFYEVRAFYASGTISRSTPVKFIIIE